MGVALGAAVLSIAAAAGARGQERDLWDRYGRVPGAHRRAASPPAPAGAGGTVCELARVDRARTSSTTCIACHDGSAGPDISFQMNGTGQGMSHPVESDYAAAAAREPAHYVPAEQLPRDVLLVDGKVTCTSCHDGASPDPKRVVNPRGLCTSCHRL